MPKAITPSKPRNSRSKQSAAEKSQRLQVSSYLQKIKKELSVSPQKQKVSKDNLIQALEQISSLQQAIKGFKKGKLYIQKQQNQAILEIIKEKASQKINNNTPKQEDSAPSRNSGKNGKIASPAGKSSRIKQRNARKA